MDRLAYSSCKKIKSSIDKHVENFGNQFIVFGIFGSLNYPIYWLIWRFFSIQSYENLSLRIVATLLCIPLIFTKYWPSYLKTWLPAYWYLTLTFCLPFFFTFMLLKNNLNSIWLMSTTAVLFWLILLVDEISFIIITIIGVIGGYLLYYFLNGVLPEADYQGIISQYVGVFLVGLIFAYNKENIKKEKLRTIVTIAESIAHELRTPLQTIAAGAEGIKLFFPKLTETYAIAKNAKLPIPKIDESHYNSLTKSLDNILSEVNSSFTFINMLLINANETGVSSKYETCSILECINLALSRYPFDSGECELVVVENQSDFNFKGDQELMIHVIFNLLKNSLYYIKAANKGKIFIRIKCDQRFNKLYFKDTGKGISKKILPHVFERFFSHTYHGTGIGLAFCKLVMKNFGGDIVAKSIEGEYVEFIMHFLKQQSVLDQEK